MFSTRRAIKLRKSRISKKRHFSTFRLRHFRHFWSCHLKPNIKNFQRRLRRQRLNKLFGAFGAFKSCGRGKGNSNLNFGAAAGRGKGKGNSNIIFFQGQGGVESWRALTVTESLENWLLKIGFKAAERTLMHLNAQNLLNKKSFDRCGREAASIKC